MVGDAGVDVYTAVVGRGAQVVVHMAGLVVGPEYRIVERRSRFLHGPQRDPGHTGCEQIRTDQPVGLLDGLAQRVLLDE